MPAACPLCGDRERIKKKTLLLYNVPVCKKCFYGFANKRQLAFLIDIALLNVAMFFTGVTIESTWGAATSDLLGFPITIAMGLVFCFKDGFSGESLGKFLMGVQAVDAASGQPIGAQVSFKRNLPTIIPIVPFVLAYQLQYGFRWGDGWAGTKVIWKKYADNPVFTGVAQPELVETDIAPNVPTPAEVGDSNNPYRSPTH